MATSYDYVDEFTKQLARKRQLAALLQQQGLSGVQLTNPNARGSWLNALAPIAQAFFGTRMANAANAEGLAHQNQVAQQTKDAIEQFNQENQGLPARPDMNLPGDLAGLSGADTRPPTDTQSIEQQQQPTNPMAQLLAGTNTPSLGDKLLADQTTPTIAPKDMTAMLPGNASAADAPAPLVPTPLNLNFVGTPAQKAKMEAAARADMAQSGQVPGPINRGPASPEDQAAAPVQSPQDLAGIGGPASPIPLMPPQGPTPAPSLAGPPPPGALAAPPNTPPPPLIPTLPNGQPDMAPQGLMLPPQPGRTPNAFDMLRLATQLPAGPQQQQFMQEALKNALVEPDRRQAMIERNQARLDSIAQRRDAALARSQDYNLSIQQRADAAKAAADARAEHEQTLLAIAGMRAQTGNAASEAPGDFSKKGDEYLASLPPEDAAVVKKIAAGEIPLTTFSTRGGHREALAKMVSQYDPTYNATRPTMWREFTSGATGKNITSINTAIAHMGTMSGLADALQNNDVQLANRAVNFLSQQLGDPSVTNFETARQAVGEELMRTFRVAGASEHEAQAWMDRFKVANSPQQLQGALKTAGELLGGRIKAVNDNWKRGTQSNNDFPNIIPPENQAILQKLGVKSSALPANAAPAATTTAALTNAKGWKLMTDKNGNQAYVSPDGKQYEEVK